MCWGFCPAVSQKLLTEKKVWETPQERVQIIMYFL